MLIQPALDLAELDAVAAALDHPVAAADVDVAVVRGLAHDVAGVVPALAVALEKESRRSWRSQ